MVNLHCIQYQYHTKCWCHLWTPATEFYIFGGSLFNKRQSRILSFFHLHSCAFHIPAVCTSLSPPSIHGWAALIKVSVLSFLSVCRLSAALCFADTIRLSADRHKQQLVLVHLAAVWTQATLQPYQGSLWHSTAANKLITPLSIDSGLKQANFILQSGQHR